MPVPLGPVMLCWARNAQLTPSLSHPLPPINLYEYHNKGVIKFAFRKWLILKDAILVVLARKGGNCGLRKEKREQAPAPQM